jgi:hypothetical protein
MPGSAIRPVLALLCALAIPPAAQAERLDCTLIETCPFGAACRSAPIRIVLERGDAGWHWSMTGQFGPQAMRYLPGSGEDGTPMVLTRLDPRTDNLSVYSLFADGSLWSTTHYSRDGESRSSTARGTCRPG